METVGAYKAKPHFSRLLDRVAKGERIAIAKHGVAVAVLQPADCSHRKPPKRAKTRNLSTHEASYLDLAMKLGLPLATQDRSLSGAARKCRVSAFEP